MNNHAGRTNRSLADRTIKLTLGAAIVLLLIMGALSSWSRVESNRSERWVKHTHEVLEKLQGLALAEETAKSSYREFALTGNEAALRPFDKKESEAMEDVAAVRRLTSDNASQQRRIALIERLTTQRIEFAEKVIVLRRTHGIEAAADAVRSMQNGQLVAEFDTAVGAAVAEELRLLALRNAEAARRLRQTNVSLVGLILLALFLVALTGRKLWHESVGRRSAEKLLRDEEAVTALLDLTHDAIFVRNRNDEIVFWNKAAERLYGWSKDEAMGKVTHELLHTVFPAPLADIDAEVVLNGYWEGDLIHERRDGTMVTVSSRWGVEFDGRGVLIGVLESNRDISQHQREDRRIQGLLEAPPDAMVVVNQNGEIVLLNHQAARKFGYAADELVGDKVTTIIPEGFAERLIADDSRTAAEALMQQMGTGVELRGRRRDGSHFPIEIMLTPLESADGILITVAIRDISVRKAAQENLQQTEERLSLVTSVTEYAILMLDLDGLVISWNEGAERIKGYRAEEILGKHFSCFYPAEQIRDGVPAQELVECARKGRFEDEGWRVRKDGSQFYADVVITALHDKAGKLRGYGKITRDITERIRGEERRARAARDLKRSHEQMEQFVYVASHDLQEPLRMVASFTQLLAKRYRGRLDTDADEFISYAVDGCNRMQSLIRDLLTYSRAGAVNRVISDASAEKALNDSVKNLEVSIDASQAVVTHDPLPDLRTDQTQLVQIFQNLVGNAIKYRGAASPVVHVSCEKDANTEWIFSVKDNGLGIASQYFERIFVIFQRLHGKHEFDGTGIGLAICKKNVEQLGGRIWVESELEKGSTFYFALPIHEGES